MFSSAGDNAILRSLSRKFVTQYYTTVQKKLSYNDRGRKDNCLWIESDRLINKIKF